MPNLTDAELREIRERAAPARPRTYQSAWQWDSEGRPVMMTAEEWLEEEADVDNSITDPDDDGPSRGGTMKAIAQEIATLRREKSEWAAGYTRLGQQLAAVREERELWKRRLRTLAEQLSGGSLVDQSFAEICAKIDSDAARQAALTGKVMQGATEAANA